MQTKSAIHEPWLNSLNEVKIHDNGVVNSFYNTGNYAHCVRNFACFKKDFLSAPKSGGRGLMIENLFYNIIQISPPEPSFIIFCSVS